MTSESLLRHVAEYYESKLSAHGATPAGVDWNSEASQVLRFRQLLRIVVPEERSGRLNDFGCGYGALAEYIGAHLPGWTYCGFDLSPKMIEAARRIHGQRPGREFSADSSQLCAATYTVASGIFNVKLDTPEDAWTEYVLGTLQTLCGVSESGFAFNVLSAYADPARKRKDLYYADPLRLFEYCRTHFSPRVALLHDYPLFEFTVLVRL